MHLTTLAGIAAAVSIVAAPAMAEMRGQWQPADCASLEARSLEAELLGCNPAILGAAVAGESSLGAEPEDEAVLSTTGLANASTSTPLASSSLGSEAW